MAKGKPTRHASALKAQRQNVARRLENMKVRSNVRTLTNKVLKAVADKNIDAAKSTFFQAQSAWQRAAHRGVFSKNVASRKIATMASRIAALSKS